MFDLHARRVWTERLQRGECGVERGRGTHAVEVEDCDGHAEFDDARDGVRRRRRRRDESNEVARGRSVVDGSRARGVAEVREVAREKVVGEVSEARRKSRGIRNLY